MNSTPVVRKFFFLVNLRFKNQLQGGPLVLNASFAPGPGRFRSRVLFHAHRSRSVQVPCFIPCPQVQVGSGPVFYSMPTGPGRFRFELYVAQKPVGLGFQVRRP